MTNSDKLKNGIIIKTNLIINTFKKIKEIRVVGISGSNSVKVTLDGEGDMQKIEIAPQLLKEEKTIIIITH